MPDLTEPLSDLRLRWFALGGFVPLDEAEAIVAELRRRRAADQRVRALCAMGELCVCPGCDDADGTFVHASDVLVALDGRSE